MIGIIGYGMVGKAVEYGFSKTDCIISDPKYNQTTVKDICDSNPDAIFVCVPTPDNDPLYTILTGVLDEIKNNDYKGITVVKSTVFPKYVEDYDIVYNPEFLSRATSLKDFVNPPFVIIGGEGGNELLKLYNKYSTVDTSKVFLTDIKTASLAKYTMNCFYAVKVSYMNEIYDMAQVIGADYSQLIEILKQQPWMGTHHFQVPGPDGERGFGGPCLPKDSQAMVRNYSNIIVDAALTVNSKHRKIENGSD